MFVILAINLFSGVKFQTFLNKDVNFRSFGVAFLSMFRACTGEDFADLMADLARQQTISFRCLQDQNYEDIQRDGFLGCGTPVSRIFFPIFQLFMSFIMMNLFIAVILQGYNTEVLSDNHKLQPETLRTFQFFWQKYDPDATGMLPIDDLENLILDLTCEELKKDSNSKQRASDIILFNFSCKRLLQLSALWRMKQDDGSREYKRLLTMPSFQKQVKRHFEKFIADLEVPTYNKTLHYNFHDVLMSFVNYLFTQCHLHEYQVRQTLKKTLRETGQTLSKLDRIEPYSEEFFKLQRQEQELLIQQQSKHFINVIHSIEEKGKNQERKIRKLIGLQEIRQKFAKQKKEILDDFGDYIVCSKRIAAIKLIKRMLNKRRKRQARVIEEQQAREEQLPSRLIMNESDEIDLNLRTHVHGITTFDYRSKTQTIQSQPNIQSFSEALLLQPRNKIVLELASPIQGLPTERERQGADLMNGLQPLNVILDVKSSENASQKVAQYQVLEEGPEQAEKRENDQKGESEKQGIVFTLPQNIIIDQTVECEQSISEQIERVASLTQVEKSRQFVQKYLSNQQKQQTTLNDSDQELLFFPSIENNSAQFAQMQKEKHMLDNFAQTDQVEYGSAAFLLVAPASQQKPQKIQAEFKGNWVFQSQPEVKVQSQRSNSQLQAQRPPHQTNNLLVSTSVQSSARPPKPFSTFRKPNV